MLYDGKGMLKDGKGWWRDGKGWWRDGKGTVGGRHGDGMGTALGRDKD